MSLVCFLQQTVCRLSCASSLEEAYFWDDGHADQFDAVYSEWSGHWQAGSTHKSIPQTQPLDIMLSMCTQLLWSTMASPVLSGTCPVKSLYGLGHRDAAQFQGLGNLLLNSIFYYAIFMKSNNNFFQILREFFAMRCHVELPVPSMREWER